MKPKVAVVSLGCVKNLIDSENIMGLLEQSGYNLTAAPEEAEVIVVNTCGFIEDAKAESINTILSLARLKNDGQCRKLVVAGCLVQRYALELRQEIPEIDAALGVNEIAGIVPILAACYDKDLHQGERLYLGNENPEAGQPLPRVLSTPVYLAYLKIAEGCDNCCSYCIIPQIRGRYRSRTMESIKEEASQLAVRGVRELVLIAQDTTRYGLDLYGRLRTAPLLAELAQIPELLWIRLLYCNPSYITEELIEAVARLPKVCHYLDIPVQHGSDYILERMNRKAKRKEIIRLVRRIRDLIPDVTLRTTFIVGFPGETEERFQELLDFVAESEFDWAGVFTYSKEEGTPASRMRGQVPAKLKEERYHQVMLLQLEITQKKNISLVGQTIPVLVEGESELYPGLCAGRGPQHAPEIDGAVHFRSPRPISPGTMVKVRISEAQNYDLIGEVV